MTPVAQADPEFAFQGLPEVADELTAQPLSTPADPLGPLAQLPGTWTGHGFNTIWRPHHPSSQDRFLELNLTTETIVFTKINGAIPNRGLLMPDINMFGLTYMQQISETSGGAGLHLEPGIWANVPQTTDPNEPSTVVIKARSTLLPFHDSRSWPATASRNVSFRAASSAGLSSMNSIIM